MKLRATLPLGLIALSVLAYAAQGIDLKWTPKAGDKINYKVEGTFAIASLGEAKLTGTRSEEITKVEDGAVTAVSSSKLVVNFGGNELPLPDSKETLKSKPDGTVLEVKVDDADAPAGALRLARVTMFVFPGKSIAMGDTWTAEGPKDEKLDLPGYKLEYKLVGEEKVGTWDTYKITAKGGETEGAAPTKIESTLWVEKTTGNLIRTVSDLKDAFINEQTLNGKMEYVRQP